MTTWSISFSKKINNKWGIIKMVTIYDKMFLENENNNKYRQLIHIQKNIIGNEKIFKKYEYK